jgi:hypothetical protein
MDKNAQAGVMTVESSDEALNTFPSEPGQNKARSTLASSAVITGALVCAVAATAAGALWFSAHPRAATPMTGSLTVESEPAGSDVFVDGKARGKTPMTLALVEGAHQLLLQRGTRTQTFPLAVKADATVVHHVTWPADVDAASAAATTGSLRIVSDPPSAAVIVDAVDRGTTPLMVAGLTVGPHDVVVRSAGKVEHRTLQVEANTTTSFVISGAAGGTPSGWVSVIAAAPLRIFEAGKLVGSSETDQIMLPAGEHSFEFSSDALGFSATRTVKVAAGQTASVTVPMPQVVVSLNASPWAQVWVDGQALGATPIGNFQTTIGSHEVIFRHPQFGERRVTALLTLKEPARLAIDMAKR